MKETLVIRTSQFDADCMIKELKFYKGWRLQKRHDFKNGNCIFSMIK